MRRGRTRTMGGVLLLALALSTPAFADNGTAVDQGYPCATAPAGQTCTVTTPAGVAGTTTTVSPVAPAPAGTTTNGVAGAHHTQASAPAPAPVSQAAQHAQTPTAAAPVASTSGTLPFTGLQLGIFALVALALIAGGIVLRRSGGREPTA